MSQQYKSRSFLLRWSQRKLHATVPRQEAARNSKLRRQAQTEHAKEEHNAIKEVPVWQREDVEETEKQAALAALFRHAEFHDVDHLNEYDEDYTTFSSLGDIVTHEMKRMMALADAQTQPEAEAEDKSDPSSESEDGEAARV